MVRLQREDVIGRTTTELGFWDDPRIRSDFIARRLRDDGLDAYPLTYRVKGGEMRDTLHSERLIELEGVPCILSHIQDITEVRRAQEELLRHRDQLEEMVKSRTLDLSNALEELTREIEARKETEAALRTREAELRSRGAELEDMNAALKILLKQRDEDRRPWR
jgi:septal ring factor EnvC (AmiA/AmiB activator)